MRKRFHCDLRGKIEIIALNPPTPPFDV